MTLCMMTNGHIQEDAARIWSLKGWEKGAQRKHFTEERRLFQTAEDIVF